MSTVPVLVALVALGTPTPAAAQAADAPAVQDGPPYEARRTLLQLSPWEPMGAAALPDSARSVFYNPSRLEGAAVQVLVQPLDEVTAVPEAIFRTAAWLVPRGDRSDQLGQVVALAGEQVARAGRTTVHIHQDVRLTFTVAGTPRVGDEFLLFRVGREIDGVGDVLLPTGRIVVTGFDGTSVIANLIAEYARVQLGDFVGRLRPFPLALGVHPAPALRTVEAQVLAFEERREIYLPGAFAFIDVGQAHGISVGDEFVAPAGGSLAEGLGIVASFQAVHVADSVATVRVISLVSPQSLRPGLRLVLDQEMP